MGHPEECPCGGRKSYLDILFGLFIGFTTEYPLCMVSKERGIVVLCLEAPDFFPL